MSLKRIYKGVLIACMGALLGCSSKHTDIELPKPPEFNLEQNLKIACVGDSITYGSTLNDRVNNSYPAQLQNLLPNSKVQIFGVDGAAAQKTALLSYWDCAAFKESQSYQPDVVFLMLGTNDSKAANWVDEAHFLQDYQALIDVYQNLSSKPDLYLLVPSAAYSLQGDGTLIHTLSVERLTTIRSAIAQLAKKNDLPLIDVYQATKNHASNYQYDGIHPDKQGTKLIADTVYKGYQTTVLTQLLYTLTKWNLSYYQALMTA